MPPDRPNDIVETRFADVGWRPGHEQLSMTDALGLLTGRIEAACLNQAERILELFRVPETTLHERNAIGTLRRKIMLADRLGNMSIVEHAQDEGGDPRSVAGRERFEELREGFLRETSSLAGRYNQVNLGDDGTGTFIRRVSFEIDDQTFLDQPNPQSVSDGLR